ncbi:hypothetical protein L210DRAFT_3639184 [Boletus edulis BED1]|uniref:BTB domain-containing protein n=1 Tax=Boletus edulis BED1 TaxID=1328754 RepID=A0AAD4GMD2_BOLED|nr:hypothetical protein L210DRAFT_3639184 [Boletus edulis BED1]
MTSEPSEGTPVAQKTESNHLDPWLDDGNIVLAVQEKYFRVHRSILSSYSAVFKDMFDCTKPGESEGERSEELIEQCPVIHLHDVVTEVQIMLKAMYDRSYSLPYYEKAPLSIVSAFLHVGEKYDIQWFIDEAKARLRCPFESTLSVAAKMTSSNTGTFTLFPGITGGDPHNFLVMNLLRKMGLKSPLPLAMYQCIIACPWIHVIDSYGFQGSLCMLSHRNFKSWVLMKKILEQFRIRLAQGLRVSTNCV